jgi:DNA repair exonuclease SbcCD ATPase subunit
MKKGLLYIAVLSLVFVGCNNNKPQTNIVTAQQTDSLQKILAQKDNEINDMMGTLNDINEGFREINEAENRVALAKQGEGTDMTQRIKENIMFIQTTMKQNRELISKLKEQLRESSFNSVQLKRTIINLTKQLDAKDQQLQQLRAELDAKDIHISELDETIANLNTNVSSLTDESNQKTQTINNQDKQLNSAWFVFGTKKELKEQHIIEDGKVLQASFNKNYFTKIDIRVDKDIKLYSKYAKLLTTHPAGSYSIQRDASDQFILHISNPQSFWSTSKYLVILVK